MIVIVIDPMIRPAQLRPTVTLTYSRRHVRKKDPGGNLAAPESVT